MTDKYKVLIVDDNEINAMLAAELVTAFGLEAVVALSGAEAIGLVKEQEFAFVLMDHIMPGMNGIEATEIIRGLSNVPIYAMTGDLNENVAADFAAAGAVSSVSKPLKPIEIVAIVKSRIPEGKYVINKELLKSAEAVEEDNSIQDAGHVHLSSYLATVTGLNYKTAITTSLGNEQSLLRLIKGSSENIREYVAILSEYMKTGDPGKLKLASHSLKTVFANIGLEELRNESEKIENKATEIISDSELTGAISSFAEDNLEIVNDYISSTLNAALELEDAIAGYEQAIAELDCRDEVYLNIESPISEDDWNETVEYTQKALERFEIDYILEGLEILKKASMGDKRKKIEAAINAANSLSYDKLIPIMNEII